MLKKMKRPLCRLAALFCAAILCLPLAACAVKKPEDTTAPRITVPVAADTDPAVPSVTSDTPDPGTSAPETAPPETKTPETEAPPAPRDKTLTFLACGDNIVHDAIIEDAAKRANSTHPNYNFYDMYQGVAPLIAKADISFINMEGCVGGPSFGYHGYPFFNAPNEIGTTFTELGYDVVNLANNHMMDYEEAGYANTIAYFRSLPVTTIGGYTKADYDDLRIVEKNGVRVAFLSYTTLINFARQLPAGSDYLLPYAREDDMTRQIGHARENADFVVVSMHWGTEEEFSPNAEQTRLAQLCADLGADVVVGHHSHTVQPAAWLTGKNGNRTLVAYSLGNFLSTMYYSQNMAGAMLSLTFRLSPAGERSVEEARIIPTVTHYSLERDGLQIYQLSDYSEELAKKHGSTLQNAFSYDILKRYYNVIPAEFLR